MSQYRTIRVFLIGTPQFFDVQTPSKDLAEWAFAVRGQGYVQSAALYIRWEAIAAFVDITDNPQSLMASPTMGRA